MSAAYRLTPFEEPLGVPNELLKRKNWIGWVAVWTERDKKTGVVRQLDKPRKIPINIKTGLADGYELAENQVTYGEALAAVGRHKLSGVGFMVMAGSGLIGGDIDKCRDPDTGVIEPWVQAIIDLRETYFEVSPSGAGVRFWALIGDLPVTLKKDAAGVELYSQGRYLTFTGQHIAGTPWEVHRAEGAVRAMMKRASEFQPASEAQKARTAASFDPTSAEAFARKVTRSRPMGQINQAAMADFDVWVPELLPDATKTADGGYRVKSRDLGRPNEEDLSISPAGIMDFGVHDMGDEREGRRTPIDVVMEWHDPPMSNVEAAEWLGVRVGVPFGLNGKSSSASPDEIKQMDDWDAALARLRAASPRPKFVTGGAINGAFDPHYTGPVALRPGVTDRLTRGFVASVSSAANAGKSTYLGSEAIAIACERPDVLGLASIDWCGNVAIISNEESENTLISRWRGVMRAHNLQASDFKHKIVFWPTDTGRLRIGRGGRDKRVTPTQDGVRCVTWLAEMAEAGQPVAVLGIDTLVSIFEGVDENGAEMDKAMGLLIAIAEAGFIAVDVMQHQGKATGTSETKDGYRGSSAIFAALAEMSTLAPLGVEEGAEFGLSALEACRTIRLRGQRQRDGQVPGEWYFLRTILSIGAEDPRAVGVLASKEVAILVPVALSRVAVVGSGLRVLWDHQAGGGVVARGSGKGGQVAADWAHSILGAALGWSRAQAEKAIVEWERDGSVETYETWPDGTHKRKLVKVKKEPKEAVSPT